MNNDRFQKFSMIFRSLNIDLLVSVLWVDLHYESNDADYYDV